MLGALSIGVFVLPFALLATVVAVRIEGSNHGLPGLAAGVGALPLLLAYLNRDGPGNVCKHQACSDEWSPWPFLAVALVLITVSLVTFARRR